MKNSLITTGGGALCLSLFMAPALAASTSSIQPEQPGLPVMEHVLVTVPLHRKQAETALPVTVLSGEALRDRVASTLGDTLSGSPGLANASFGPGVGQPVIRGQQGARVMVLQNSTGSADASNSSADHAVAVEPVLAESVEVLRGPATLLYGGGAIGGVINVIDKRVPVAVPEQPSGALELRHGSVNDENSAVFTANGGVDRWAFHVDGVTRDSNNVRIPGTADSAGGPASTRGYIANTDSDMQTFTAGGSYIGDRGFVGLAVNRLDNEYGVPPGDDEAVRLDIEQTRYDLRADYHFDDAPVESVRWFLTRSHYRHNELEDGNIGTRWRNDSWEQRLEFVHRPLAGWHGVAGIQTMAFEFAAVGDESFIPQTDVNRYGLFVLEDYHWRDWQFELGGRWDRDQLDPDAGAPARDFNNVSLASSAMWQMSANWRVGLALSASQRAPVIEELYSNTGNSLGNYVVHAASESIEVGDSSLDSEQSGNVDLTISYQTDTVDGFVTVFFNNFQDYIYLANSGLSQAGTDILFYRQRDAQFTGVEFKLDLNLGEWLAGTVDVELHGDWIQGELDGGADVPRLPPARVGTQINYRVGDVRTYIGVLNAQNQDRPGANELPTDGYTRWDAGIDYSIGLRSDREMLLFLKVKNLTDEEIRESTSLLREVAPEPGRSVETGIRYTF